MSDLEEPEAGRNQSPADSPRVETSPFPAELPLLSPNPGPTAAEHALAVLRIPFHAFWQIEPAVRRGLDPEAVHDMRVAARRMRAGISLFRDFLPATAQTIRDELRWVASSLGTIRDLDLQIEQVRAWSRKRLSGGPDAAGSILSLLDRNRDEARSSMLAALDSDRYRTLVADMTLLLDGRPAAEGGPQSQLREIAPDLIRRRMKSVRRAARRAARSERPEEYHELRIRSKRLRYTLEFLSTLYGRPAERMIRALVRIQDILGEHQDAQAGIEQMQKLAETDGAVLQPRALLTVGEIVGCYRRMAERRRADLPKALRGIRGARWRALKKAMQPPRPTDRNPSDHEPAVPRPAAEAQPEAEA